MAETICARFVNLKDFSLSHMRWKGFYEKNKYYGAEGRNDIIDTYGEGVGCVVLVSYRFYRAYADTRYW